MQNKIFLFV